MVVEIVCRDKVVQASGHDREDPEGFLHGGRTQMVDARATAGGLVALTYRGWPGALDAQRVA